jgi:hypothetical protein
VAAVREELPFDTVDSSFNIPLGVWTLEVFLFQAESHYQCSSKEAMMVKASACNVTLDCIVLF